MGQQTPGYLKQQKQELKQDSATGDTSNWVIAVGIRMSHSGTAWWKSKTVPPREVCSQGTPSLGWLFFGKLQTVSIVTIFSTGIQIKYNSNFPNFQVKMEEPHQHLYATGQLLLN